VTTAGTGHEQQHRHLLEVLVAAAAPRCQNLAELLGYLPGAYPAEAADVLSSLASRHLIDELTSRRLQASGVPPAQLATPPRQANAPGIELPDPHPLDFDWRWTAQTATGLVTRCTGTTGPGDTIALLGTPTLLPLAVDAPHRRHWLLLEASTATTSVLAARWPEHVQRCDLATGQLPHLSARVVVADPPWYPEHTRAFLWAAAHLSIPGATILLAQPALATRPGILDERAGLLAYAHGIGLELAAICPSTLAYTCPPFEQRALAATGLSASVPSDWRRGDLIELRRTTAPPGPRPRQPSHERWDEITAGRARIRFRLDTEEPGQHGADPRLIPLVPGDILGSVSRRNPIRAHVRVWTAGNRVFGCAAPALLKMIAASIAAGTPADRPAQADTGRPLHADELVKIRAAAAQLRDLIQAEHRDSARDRLDIAVLPTKTATVLCG